MPMGQLNSWECRLLNLDRLFTGYFFEHAELLILDCTYICNCRSMLQLIQGILVVPPLMIKESVWGLHFSLLNMKMWRILAISYPLPLLCISFMTMRRMEHTLVHHLLFYFFSSVPIEQANFFSIFIPSPLCFSCLIDVFQGSPFLESSGRRWKIPTCVVLWGWHQIRKVFVSEELNRRPRNSMF